MSDKHNPTSPMEVPIDLDDLLAQAEKAIRENKQAVVLPAPLFLGLIVVCRGQMDVIDELQDGMKRIAEMFGMSVEELLAEEEDAQPKPPEVAILDDDDDGVEPWVGPGGGGRTLH